MSDRDDGARRGRRGATRTRSEGNRDEGMRNPDDRASVAPAQALRLLNRVIAPANAALAGQKA